MTEPEHAAPSDHTTLTDVLEGYADAGFTASLAAQEGGVVRCDTCGSELDPGGIRMRSLRRLEGASDPDDMLAVVALGALVMMMRMVRRAVPAGAEDVDTEVFITGPGGKKIKKKGAGGVEQLDAADDIFGEANQGEAVLTGIELDDETLASRKMVDEVSVMIKENPENAAALVKRWMTKNK